MHVSTPFAVPVCGCTHARSLPHIVSSPVLAPSTCGSKPVHLLYIPTLASRRPVWVLVVEASTLLLCMCHLLQTRKATPQYRSPLLSGPLCWAT